MQCVALQDFSINHDDGGQERFLMVVEWEQFQFGGIKIYEPLINHRLEVFFKSSGQVDFVDSLVDLLLRQE